MQVIKVRANTNDYFIQRYTVCYKLVSGIIICYCWKLPFTHLSNTNSIGMVLRQFRYTEDTSYYCFGKMFRMINPRKHIFLSMRHFQSMIFHQNGSDHIFVKYRLINQVLLRKQENTWFLAELKQRSKGLHKFPVGSEIISLGTKQVVSINMACFGSMKATTHHILLKRENMH